MEPRNYQSFWRELLEFPKASLINSFRKLTKFFKGISPRNTQKFSSDLPEFLTEFHNRTLWTPTGNTLSSFEEFSQLLKGTLRIPQWNTQNYSRDLPEFVKRTPGNFRSSSKEFSEFFLLELPEFVKWAHRIQPGTLRIPLGKSQNSSTEHSNLLNRFPRIPPESTQSSFRKP